MGKSKEPIRLRQRLNPSGLTRLYLDVYVEGRRSYEYLKLYLVPEKSRADKEKNRQTIQLAEAIRAKRIVELRNNQYGFRTSHASSLRFFDYFEAVVESKRKPDKLGTFATWRSALSIVRDYEPRANITFADITTEWVAGLRAYIDVKATKKLTDGRTRIKGVPYSNSSKRVLFDKVRACINKAINEGIIQDNPLQGVKGFTAEDTTRMYLTIDEVKRLANTPCSHPEVASAFLFACLTGLRRSDVERLVWGDVYEQGGFTRIIYRQKKTSGQEYLDISEQAAALMGERGKADERVFPQIYTTSSTNAIIKVWVAQAGIKKDITFHCARHTFATMMLDLGVDIYTVSKLLGHRELSTTQIYAKVLDKSKQAAVASIPPIFGDTDEAT